MKAIFLSASALLCCDHLLVEMLMHTLPAVIEVSVQQYVFVDADEATCTEECSFYAYRIYLCEFTFFFLKSVRLILVQ